jgi:DNA-directed RNA polymerase specialized sigma subunit
MENEREQWRQYRLTGDIAIRDELIKPYMVAANTIARQYSHRDDARQDALLGLLMAAETYDPDKRYSFRAWALSQMRGEAHRSKIEVFSD